MAAFNHVGAGLICKACRQPFVKFCPSSGRPARFCSACGSPLDWRSDSSSRVREQHEQVGSGGTQSSSPLRRKGISALRKGGSDDEDVAGRRRGRGGGGGGGYDGGMGGLLLAPVLMRKPPTGAVAIAGAIGMAAVLYLALVWSSTLGVQWEPNLRGTPAAVAVTPEPPLPLRLENGSGGGSGGRLSWMAWKTASNQTSSRQHRAQVLTALPGDQPLDVARGVDSKLGQTLLVVLLVVILAYTLYWKGLLLPVACACCKLVAKMKSDYDQSREEAAAIEDAAAERQSRRHRKSSGHSSRISRSKGKGHLSASLVDDGFHSCDDQDECGRKLVSNDRAILEGMQASIRERLTSRWTAEELSKVRKLASFIQEQTSYSSKEAEGALVSAFGCSDRCAWRFLRSTGWNLKQARQRFLETAAWRVNVLSQRPGLDGSMAFSAKGEVPRKPVTPASLRLFGSEDGRRLFPCVGWDGGLYNRGKDSLAEEKRAGQEDGNAATAPAQNQWWQAKEGSPVELWRVELVDIPELFAKLSEEDVMDAYLEYNERRRHRVNEVGAAGYIVLIDAANFGFSHLGKFMACARQAAGVIGSVGERHYPGSIRRAIIFNAPSFIYTIYRVVQPVLSAATRESVAIHSCGADEVEELQELLPEGTMEEMIKQLPI